MRLSAAPLLQSLVLMAAALMATGCLWRSASSVPGFEMVTYSGGGTVQLHDSASNPTTGDEYAVILPGQTVELAEIEGPGIIRRLWMASQQDGPIGRTLVVRIYWDGLEHPAIEVPYGDFFGASHVLEDSPSPGVVADFGMARSVWWPMPFARSARVTVTNEGSEAHRRFYYEIEVLKLDSAPTPLRLHAQYRQSYPAHSASYTVVDTGGRGHYLGTTYHLDGGGRGGWQQSNELVEVDGRATLRHAGLGDLSSEVWGVALASNGWSGTALESRAVSESPVSESRFRSITPLEFRDRLRVALESTELVQYDTADHLSSVAWWYQVPPAAAHPALPPVEDRLLPRDRSVFIRDRAWQLAVTGRSVEAATLQRLLARAPDEPTRLLVTGLIAYHAGRFSPSSTYQQQLDESRRAYAEIVDANSESAAELRLAQRMLGRASFDLARRVALQRGLASGDELVYEAVDFSGNLAPPPLYEESSDFLFSTVKVDSQILMGSGSRFTPGNGQESYARFTPSFPASGNYEVYVNFGFGANAGDTRYEVRHADGIATVPLPQLGRPGTPGRNADAWHSLGVYRFERGQDTARGSIALLAGPNNTIPNESFGYRAYVDSVRLIYFGE